MFALWKARFINHRMAQNPAHSSLVWRCRISHNWFRRKETNSSNIVGIGPTSLQLAQSLRKLFWSTTTATTSSYKDSICSKDQTSVDRIDNTVTVSTLQYLIWAGKRLLNPGTLWLPWSWVPLRIFPTPARRRVCRNRPRWVCRNARGRAR